MAWLTDNQFTAAPANKDHKGDLSVPSRCVNSTSNDGSVSFTPRSASCGFVQDCSDADLAMTHVNLLNDVAMNFPPRILSIMDEQQRLQSPDVQQRAAATEALSQMGPDAAFAAVELVNACADEEIVREGAVAALEELGPPTPEVLPRLVPLVSSSDSLVAYWAITLLGRAGSAARFSQDELASLLTTSTVISLRERAAWALSKVDATSEVAILALENAAASSELRLSRLAKVALKQTTA